MKSMRAIVASGVVLFAIGANASQVQVEQALAAISSVDASKLVERDRQSLADAQKLLKDGLASLTEKQREFVLRESLKIQLYGNWRSKDYLGAAEEKAYKVAIEEMKAVCGVNRYPEISELSRYIRIDGDVKMGPWAGPGPRSYIGSSTLFATVPVSVDLTYRCHR